MMELRKLDELKVYNLAMRLGNDIWILIEKWNHRNAYSLGNQLIRSVDSIAANISEGYGRQSASSNRSFCYYARGSLFETKTWLNKALERNLLTKNEFQSLISILIKLNRHLDAYIRFLTAQKYKTKT